MSESTQILQQLLDASPLGMFYLDTEGCYSAYNRSHAEDMFQLFGVHIEPGHNFLEYIPQPDQRDNARRVLQQALAGGQPGISLRLAGSDEHRQPFEINYIPTSKSPAGICLVATDSSDPAEQALRSAAEYNRSLIEVSLDPLVTIGPDGRITDVNHATERATGCTRAELIGTDFSSYFSEPDLARAGYQQVFRDGQVVDYPLELRHRSGQTLSVLYNAAVYRDAHGAVVGVFAAARDITDRQRAEQALQAAHDLLEQRVEQRTAELSTANLALEKAILSRDQFLAAMSHEMRTPLTGILGLSQALMFNTDGSLGPRHLKALENIEKSGQRLLQLVNNVIDYNQLKFGKAIFELAPCSVLYNCKASLQAMRARADAKQQRLDLVMEPADIQCVLDEKRIRQMLNHLLDNAIKFSPANSTITLRATALPETAQLRLSVEDNGIGIRPEDLPRLFDPLTQLDARLSRGYEGSGLGLPLVQALAELHGGEVQVQSTPGVGSCFSVLLPWREARG
jgi:PAS domain S-box-containing protein